jgi:ankyrin repeat domain-containing protein 50
VSCRFRWVALQIDELSDCTTMKSLHHTLHSLPKTLDETYNRILDKVKEHNRPLVQHILECVCFFVRPISVEEVRHIWRIGNHRKPPFDSEDALFDQKDVIDLCSGLLSLVLVHPWEADVEDSPYFYDQARETVQFAHFSVKEYLLSTRAMSWRLDEELSHLYIVKAGVAYYLELMASGGIISPGASEEGFHRNHSLAVYCVWFTKDHLSHLKPRDHPDLTESFQYLLDPMLQPNLDRKIGLCHFLDILDEDKFSSPDKAEPLEVSTLRIAACLGLPMICQWLLSINTLAQISSTVTESGVGSSFLTNAAVYGHAEVLNVLLKAGADMNKKFRVYVPALHVVAQDGHRECVEILINSGADVNMEYDAKTAVDLGMQGEHEDIVKILRDAGGRSSLELKAHALPSWYLS